MSASMEARIAEHAAAPTPPLPIASSPLPLPSPLTTSPTDARWRRPNCVEWGNVELCLHTPRTTSDQDPFARTRLRRARKTVRPEPPMSASIEVRIAEHAAAPTPPLPVAPSPLPLLSPLTTSPTDFTVMSFSIIRSHLYLNVQDSNQGESFREPERRYPMEVYPRVSYTDYDGLPHAASSPTISRLWHHGGPPLLVMLTRSPSGLCADLIQREGSEEDSEEHADYPADGGDGDDEPFGDDSDDDTDDDDEEPFEDEEDDEEEEEHLAPAEIFSYTCDRHVSVRHGSCQTEHRCQLPWEARLRSMLPHYTTYLLPPSPLPLTTPLTTSPTNAGAPLGYKAAGIRMRAAAASLPLSLPSTDILEAEMLPRKRACLTTPVLGCEIGETRPLEGVDQRVVTELATTVRKETEEFQRGVYARIAWTSSEERSAAIEAHVRTLEAQVATLISQTASLQTRLTTTLGRIATLEARDLEPQDGPAEAGSSC
ncbi:hypothetical protein Tco_1139037 [Tanacetum coccineum]